MLLAPEDMPVCPKALWTAQGVVTPAYEILCPVLTRACIWHLSQGEALKAGL